MCVFLVFASSFYILLFHFLLFVRLLCWLFDSCSGVTVHNLMHIYTYSFSRLARNTCWLCWCSSSNASLNPSFVVPFHTILIFFFIFGCCERVTTENREREMHRRKLNLSVLVRTRIIFIWILFLICCLLLRVLAHTFTHTHTHIYTAAATVMKQQKVQLITAAPAMAKIMFGESTHSHRTTKNRCQTTWNRWCGNFMFSGYTLFCSIFPRLWTLAVSFLLLLLLPFNIIYVYCVVYVLLEVVGYARTHTKFVCNNYAELFFYFALFLLLYFWWCHTKLLVFRCCCVYFYLHHFSFIK